MKAVLGYNMADARLEPTSTRHDEVPNGCADMAVTSTVASTVPSDRFTEALQVLEMSEYVGSVERSSDPLGH